jgi:hypothetical protein
MIHRSSSAISSCLRWVVIAANLALGSQAVPQDKPPETPQSRAALQTVARILDTWKAREDRTRSLHCVWDSEQSIGQKPGERLRLAASKNEFWLGRDTRCRFEMTTERFDRVTRRTETSVQWTVFDGRAYSTLKWSERSTLPRRGRVFDFGRKSVGFLDRELMPLAWAYRPSSRGDLKPGQLTVVTDDAIVEGIRCTKLRLSGQDRARTSFWFDPHQSDALVCWELELSGRPFSSLLLRYRPDKSNDPALTGWTERNNQDNSHGAEDVSQVKTIEINRETPADAFQIKFPPGTAVAIDLKGSTQEAYVVKPDGTKRPVFNLNTISTKRLRDTLLQQTEFTIEPEPLRDAVDFIRQRYAIGIEIDAASFRKAQIDPSLEVREDMPGIRCWEVLTWLSAQCPHPFGIFEQNGKLVLKALE